MPDKETLVCENLGLVHSCARRFMGRGVDYEELYSCGCIGLVKAASGYNCDLGYRFSTYAVPVILGEIRRIFRDGGSVKVSRTLKELSLRAERQRSEYIKKNGSEPSLSKLSELLGISIEKTNEALCAAHLPLSLSQFGDGSDEGYRDIEVPSDEEKLTEKLSLYEALDKLSVEDMALIELRYFKSKTQTQTAAELNMTQVQVSRREKKILALLRESMRT